MKKSKSFAGLSLLLAMGLSACAQEPAQAPVEENAEASAVSDEIAARTPVEVVQHHVDVIKEADMEGLMIDYAQDTVVITPEGMVPGQYPEAGPGVFVGYDQAEDVMEFLTSDEMIVAVRSMVARIEPIGDTVAILHWTQFEGTPQEVQGQDVFIVKDGKITMQYLVP